MVTNGLLWLVAKLYPQRIADFIHDRQSNKVESAPPAQARSSGQLLASESDSQKALSAIQKYLDDIQLWEIYLSENKINLGDTYSCFDKPELVISINCKYTAIIHQFIDCLNPEDCDQVLGIVARGSLKRKNVLIEALIRDYAIVYDNGSQRGLYELVRDGLQRKEEEAKRLLVAVFDACVDDRQKAEVVYKLYLLSSIRPKEAEARLVEFLVRDSKVEKSIIAELINKILFGLAQTDKECSLGFYSLISTPTEQEFVEDIAKYLAKQPRKRATNIIDGILRETLSGGRETLSGYTVASRNLQRFFIWYYHLTNSNVSFWQRKFGGRFSPQNYFIQEIYNGVIKLNQERKGSLPIPSSGAGSSEKLPIAAGPTDE